jgi:hypothetical protein
MGTTPAPGTLEALRFDNLALRALPVDKEEGRGVREVRGACYARVKPTPLERPCLVAASSPALALLDLAPAEVISLDTFPAAAYIMDGWRIPCRHLLRMHACSRTQSRA